MIAFSVDSAINVVLVQVRFGTEVLCMAIFSHGMPFISARSAERFKCSLFPTRFKSAVLAFDQSSREWMIGTPYMLLQSIETLLIVIQQSERY